MLGEPPGSLLLLQVGVSHNYIDIEDVCLFFING
jgi:hypothetical protein